MLTSKTRKRKAYRKQLYDKLQQKGWSGCMYPHVTMLEQGCTPQTHTDVHTNTLIMHILYRHTHCDCRPGSQEKVQHADTQRTLSEKWDTLQPPDPQPLTSPFQTAFLLLSEADKFIPLVSKQSPLFFCRLHQWKKEGGSRSEGGIHLPHRATL